VASHEALSILTLVQLQSKADIRFEFRRKCFAQGASHVIWHLGFHQMSEGHSSLTGTSISLAYFRM
jgi:hypothetical protein